MNMTKRITAALTAMTLCFSLAACSSDGGNAGGDAAKGKTPAEQVAAAVEKLNAVKNFSISMQQDVDMSMKVADQSQDFDLCNQYGYGRISKSDESQRKSDR